MIGYIFKRLAHALPILLGANIITFCLFFMVNSPDDIARMNLGDKYTTQAMVEQWKVKNGYDHPLFWNDQAQGLSKVKDTLLVDKTVDMFSFNFGKNNDGRNIIEDVKLRMWPSLAIAMPTLVLGLVANLLFALFFMLFRYGIIEQIGLLACIVLMSISGLFYIIGGQYLFSIAGKLGPISGYVAGTSAVKFVIIPVAISVVSGLGTGVRWYHSIMQEEMHKEYVKTARAKGLSAWRVLKGHILPNALVPIVTSVVAIIPLLFMGSLLMESFFAIPGLGSYTIEAIHKQDFEVVRAMVFLGSIFYIIGLILTDIVYTIVDPRISFK